MQLTAIHDEQRYLQHDQIRINAVTLAEFSEACQLLGFFVDGAAVHRLGGDILLVADDSGRNRHSLRGVQLHGGGRCLRGGWHCSYSALDAHTGQCGLEIARNVRTHSTPLGRRSE